MQILKGLTEKSMIELVATRSEKIGRTGSNLVAHVIVKGSNDHPTYSLFLEDLDGNYWSVNEQRFMTYRKARLDCRKAGLVVPDHLFPGLFAEAKFGRGLADAELYARRDGLEAFFGHLFCQAQLSKDERIVLCKVLPWQQIDAKEGKQVLNARKLGSQGTSCGELNTPLTFLQSTTLEKSITLTLDSTQGNHPIYELQVIEANTQLVFVKSRFARFFTLKQILGQQDGFFIANAPIFPKKYVTSRLGLRLSNAELESRRIQLEEWCRYFIIQLFPKLPIALQRRIITIDLPVHTFAAVQTEQVQGQASTTTIEDKESPTISVPAADEDEPPPQHRHSTIIKMTESDEKKRKEQRRRTSAGGGLFDRVSQQLKELKEVENRMHDIFIVFALRNVKNLPDAEYSYASSDPEWYVTGRILEIDDEDDTTLTEKSAIRKGDDSGCLEWDPPPSMVFMAPNGDDDMWEGRKLVLCLYDKNMSTKGNINMNNNIATLSPVQKEIAKPLRVVDNDTTMPTELAFEEEDAIETDIDIIRDDPDALVAYGVISNLRQFAKIDHTTKEPIFTNVEIDLIDADNQSIGASLCGDLTVLSVDDALLVSSIQTTALVRYEKYEPPEEDFWSQFNCTGWLSPPSESDDNKSKQLMTLTGSVLEHWKFTGYLVAKDYTNAYAATLRGNIEDLIEDTNMNIAAPLKIDEVVIEDWCMRHNPGQEDAQGFQYAYSLDSSQWSPVRTSSKNFRRSVWYRETRKAVLGEKGASTSDLNYLGIHADFIEEEEDEKNCPPTQVDQDLHVHSIARFTSVQQKRVQGAHVTTLPSDVATAALSFASAAVTDIVLDIGCCGSDGQFPIIAVREFNVNTARSILVDDGTAVRAQTHVTQILGDKEAQKVHIIHGHITTDSDSFRDSFRSVTLLVLYLSAEALRLVRPLILRFLLIDDCNNTLDPTTSQRRVLAIGTGPLKLTPIRISYLTSSLSSSTLTAFLYDGPSILPGEALKYTTEHTQPQALDFRPLKVLLVRVSARKTTNFEAASIASYSTYIICL